MVQYIHTPWRDRAELLRVRRQFYPSQHQQYPPPSPPSAAAAATSSSSITSPSAAASSPFAATAEQEAEKRHAVNRVAVWAQRGGCPHMVESTGLLMAAALDDLREASMGLSSSTSAVRLAYSAAFSRFVTGLLDSHQDKQQKQSMYSIAKTIGLPATFVELRHQCTHEQLPPLLRLRSAAQKSLAWIWDYYWIHLSGDDNLVKDAMSTGDKCRDYILKYLTGDHAEKTQSLGIVLKQWGDLNVLRALEDLGQTSEDPKVILRSLQLSRAILAGTMGAPEPGVSEDPTTHSKDLDKIRAEFNQASDELRSIGSTKPARTQRMDLERPIQTKGWTRYEGTWTPKPIGVV